MADKVAINAGSPAFSLRLMICGLQQDIRNKIPNYRIFKSAKPTESLARPTSQQSSFIKTEDSRSKESNGSVTVSKPAVGLSPLPSWSGIREKTLRRCGNRTAIGLIAFGFCAIKFSATHFCG
jgi:hypothetical protein